MRSIWRAILDQIRWWRRVIPPLTELAAAGFTETPAPKMILIRAEQCAYQPVSLIEVGLVRVRYGMRSGGWAYDTVPMEAIVG